MLDEMMGLPQQRQDPVEKGIERINAFIISMGMRPMRAAEIEPILMQHMPRKAIRGIKKAASPAKPMMPKAAQGMPMGMGQQGMPQMGGMR